jgi:flagellar biosynthesis protein FlhG
MYPPDQAATLRLSQNSTALCPLLAVGSGKGGVGKTFLSVNLALALRDLGYRCLLVDLDWGLANVDVALGLAPRWHIGHVLAGECRVEDVLIEHEGLAVVPNGCGHAGLAQVEFSRRAALVDSVRALVPPSGLVVADTHPGISELTLDVLREAHVSVVVSTPEPTAMTDTYALYKVLGRTRDRGATGLVMNQSRSGGAADAAAQHLDTVARRFLGHGIDYWGHLLRDEAVPRCVAQQRPCLTAAPRSHPARAVRDLARRLAPLLA